MAKTSSLSTKLLVSNRAALTRKYGAAGVKMVEKAVRALTAADRKRGLSTRLVYLDGAALGKVRVRDPGDPAENKAAIDALSKKHRPEYLVILGSRDVVPYQDLRNRLHEPADPESDPGSIHLQRPSVRLRSALQPACHQVSRADACRRPDPRSHQRDEADPPAQAPESLGEGRSRSADPIRHLRSARSSGRGPAE